MNVPLPGLRLGIVGGGQLGRMMAVEARRLGVHTIVLDPAEKPPAAGIADETLRGGLYDGAALGHLANHADVVTYEIEHINTTALHELEASGCRLLPRPGLLETIQDKLVQKSFLDGRGLPVPAYASLAAADVAAYRPARYPFVQKARSGGYDGRGVAVIRSEAELPSMLHAESMVEDYVPLKAELAVLLARGTGGELAVYPVIEMVFDPRAQICSSVCAPARVPAAVAEEARRVAVAAIEALDGVGIFAVELFWAEDGRVLINEIAPRPHNSGHWTIEGAVTNQFEQHVRAVCGLPLGSPELLRPSVMVNLLGAPGATGRPVLAGAAEALALPGVKLHWYQKETVSPLRKMGHFTVTAATVEEALGLAERAAALLEVRGTGQ